MFEVSKQDNLKYQPRIESPIHYLLGKFDSIAGIAVGERCDFGHLVVRGDEVDNNFRQTVESLVQLDLPSARQPYLYGQTSEMFWLGPSEWLIVTDINHLETLKAKFRSRSTARIPIIDVTGGQTIINLSGTHVGDLLKKASPYNFESDTFRARRCALTNFAKATVIVVKKSDESFDCIVRRCFAAYIVKWLLVSCAEYESEYRSG